MDFLKSSKPFEDDGSVVAVLRGCGRCRGAGFVYPFGSPVSIERHHLKVFREVEYWITDKADGVRVCLVLTMKDSKPIAVLVDRRGLMYEFFVTCDTSYFADSVFDCEVVATREGSYLIAVFDVGAIAGDTSVAQLPLAARLEELAQIFPVKHWDAWPELGHIVAYRKDVALTAKKMVPLQAGAGVDPLAQLAGVGYATDGYVLTPCHEAAPGPGVAASIFKVKTSHTLDLLWVGGDLYLGSGDHKVSVTTVGGGDLAVPAVRVDVASFASTPPNSVVEVAPEVDASGIVLRLLRVREDRSFPNHMKCVVSTLRSVVDCVTIQDVVASTKLCA